MIGAATWLPVSAEVDGRLGEVYIHRTYWNDGLNQWVLSKRKYARLSLLGEGFGRDVPTCLYLYIDEETGVVVADLPTFERAHA